MKKIGIYGSNGRMGKALISALKESKSLVLGELCDKDGDLAKLFANSDCVIDFSTKSATKALLKFALNNEKALVIGTTGLDENDHLLMKKVSLQSPLFYASNMSLGIGVLNELCFKAAKMLEGFDIEICELHHKHKIDAPSGSALSLAKSVAKARDLDLDSCMVNGRSKISPRKKDEIGVFSLRGGDVAGRHCVGFYGDGEYLEFNHQASSRMTFAYGALKAAQWLLQRQAGLYGMRDLLDF